MEASPSGILLVLQHSSLSGFYKQLYKHDRGIPRRAYILPVEQGLSAMLCTLISTCLRTTNAATAFALGVLSHRDKCLLALKWRESVYSFCLVKCSHVPCLSSDYMYFFTPFLQFGGKHVIISRCAPETLFNWDQSYPKQEHLRYRLVLRDFFLFLQRVLIKNLFYGFCSVGFASSIQKKAMNTNCMI